MRVTVGIPMYQGTGGLPVRSLLSLQAALIERGDVVDFDIVTGGSIITKVRNSIVRRFLEGQNDVLLFIDADMVYAPETALKLINSGASVSVCNYRARRPDIKWMCRPVTPIEASMIDGNAWIECEAAGTGIMAIGRKCLEVMAESFADTAYEDNGPTVGLFDFANQDGHYYGEDYLFCKRWRGMGGQIWMLADATIGHMGETSYNGNYLRELQKVEP